jgi:membrane protein DedA with SNARE-associated domain
MSAQLALKHTYLSVIAAAGISGLISAAGSYLMGKRVNDTLARHGKLHERTNDTLARHEKLLEYHGKLLQETSEKVNEVQRLLRKKTRCFML